MPHRSQNRLPCGCRRSICRRRGHRPACPMYDMERAAGQLKRRRLRRKYEN